MNLVSVHNLTRPLARPVHARWCATFPCQLRGLMFTRSLEPEQGLLLVQRSDDRLASAIHMMGMWIDLAIIWINAQCVVVDVRLAQRWHPAYVPRQPARYVLELQVERLQDFQIGDQLSFVDENLA